MKRIRSLCLIVICAAVLCFLWVFIPQPRKTAMQLNIAIGNNIVADLEKWKTKTGTYPKTLDELYPKPPTCLYGPQWSYQRNAIDFSLSFQREHDFTGAYYSHSTKQWLYYEF